MKLKPASRALKILSLIILSSLLSGCIEWFRIYQTYLQLNEFDRYFSVAVKQDFTLHFNQPRITSNDFINLTKLYPSENLPTPNNGRQWRYWFCKVNAQQEIIHPEIKFFTDLRLNQENQLHDWSFSTLFLQIAPAQFLEVSLRSLAGAEISEEKQQLKAKTILTPTISAELPLKSEVLRHFGEPISIEDNADHEVYRYFFKLLTTRIEKGYEGNALNEIKLSFDKKNQRLFNMAGNFAGLKIAIDYRNFLAPNTTEHSAKLTTSSNASD